MNRTSWILLAMIGLCLLWAIIFIKEPLFIHETTIDTGDCFLDVNGDELCADLSRVNVGPTSSKLNWWGIPPLVGRVGLVILVPYFLIYQLVKVFKKHK